MEKVIKDNWKDILNILEKRGVSVPVINAWLEPLKLYKIEDNVLYFLVNSDQRAIDFMKARFYDMELLMAIQEYTNNTQFNSIQFILSEEEANSDVKTPSSYQSNNIYKQYLNPKYTFDSFIVGENNRMAQATAVAVADAPGEAYNPLFIYGGSGLGKTHLIQAAAHYTLDKNPDSKVLYVTSEKFTNELIDAIKANTTNEFRRKYRELDVLLIDDIQFIIDKDSTQEEFFHTFNTLKEAKKQIILSSDRPPKELNGMPDRLINRFESGILADIGSPNYEIRMAILRKKAESEHLNIGDDILQFIAEHITSNIRELEGALNKIFVYSKLQNNSEPIDIAFAEEALKDMIKPDKIHEITPDLIIETVCEHYKITKEQIISSSRSQNIAKPRMIAMYLCKNLLSNMTLKEIGSYLGGKNHTTVMHGCEKVVEDMEDDPNFRNNIDILINKISS
jgi:chromosomal replication initiator protein